MKQMTMASSGFQKFSKTTRRAQFLSEMDQVVLWAELCALIEPVYPIAGNGRPPKPLEMMLRIHLLQQWFNLSDPGVEEALYDSELMRRFAGIDLGHEPVPDETTILNFRHLLERNNLGMRIFQAVGAHLQARGMKLSNGTIVDATIVSAPSSTKNQQQQRDPQMHQTRKGKQWYFGMKVHVGVDRKTKLIHSTVVTAANEADWRDDARAFMQSCDALGVPAALEVSRSGRGAHAWIFLASRVSARDARRLGTASGHGDHQPHLREDPTVEAGVL